MESELLSLIDKNKSNISDGDYIKFCNILKNLYNSNEKMYLIKYYKLSYENDLRTFDIQQNFKIKTKKVIIENDDNITLDKLNELCNAENSDFMKFSFITKEDHKTYIKYYSGCNHIKSKFHLIQTDDEDDESTKTMSIDYDDIFIISYKKLNE